MNLTDLLYQNAEENGERIAFREGDKSCTYRELASMTQYAARKLREAGVGKGTKILLLEPISVRMYVLLLAIWQLGASVIVFDPAASPDYIEKCLSRVTPDFFIGCRKAFLLKLKIKYLRTIPQNKRSDVFFFKDRHRPPHGLEETEPGCEDAPALITFTSGSTGIPKVAVRTQNFLCEQFRVISLSMPYEEGDVDLAVLPVFTIANIAGKITTVIPDKSIAGAVRKPPKKLVDQLVQCRVNRISGSPAIIGAIADCAAEEGKAVPTVTKLFLGGGPVFLHLLNNMGTAFPNAELQLVYGSTEAEPIAEIGYGELTNEQIQNMGTGHGLIAGSVIPQLSCRVIQCKGNALPAELTQPEFDALTLTHDVGEIVVSGNHVLSGYLDGIGNRETKFDVDGVRWHRTGDLGYFDREGLLWLMGREQAAVSDERGTIYPFAVESAMSARYGIRHSSLLLFHGRRVLVLEPGSAGTPDADVLKKEFLLDDILLIKEMPMDIRHHAKVDYGKLNAYAEKKLSY